MNYASICTEEAGCCLAVNSREEVWLVIYGSRQGGRLHAHTLNGSLFPKEFYNLLSWLASSTEYETLITSRSRSWRRSKL